MINLRQKLLIKLFREFRDENFYKGTGSYKPGRKLSLRAKPIDRVYQTVDRYMELDYTEDIIDYYKKLHLVSLKERAFQRQKDNKIEKRKKQEQENLKFIEENELVEHPRFKGYYGRKDSRVFSSKGSYGTIRELKPVYQKSNNGYYMMSCGRDENNKAYQIGWHRFIAEIFIPNPNNLPQVNHLDENKGNNRVDNLEWSTHLDNIRYSSDNWGGNFLIENLKTGEKYEIVNLAKWCRDIGVSRKSAHDCMNGKALSVKKKTYKVTRFQSGLG
jgi:hypothetical protein